MMVFGSFLRFVVVLILSGCATSAFASGSRVGNGGVGVVCAGSFAPQLLDLFEATEVYGRIPAAVFLDQRSQAEHLISITGRLREILGADHPLLGALSETSLLQATMTLSDGPLRITNDTGIFTGIKSGCHSLQIAARGEGVLDGKLEILRSYWFGISEQEKALLLVHEALHSWFSSPDFGGGLDDLADDAVGTLALRQFIGLLYTDSPTYPQTAARIRALVQTRASLGDLALSHAGLL